MILDPPLSTSIATLRAADCEISGQDHPSWALWPHSCPHARCTPTSKSRASRLQTAIPLGLLMELTRRIPRRVQDDSEKTQKIQKLSSWSAHVLLYNLYLNLLTKPRKKKNIIPTKGLLVRPKKRQKSKTRSMSSR